MTEQEQRVGKARIVDGNLAKILGWTELKILRKPGPPPSAQFAKYVLVGIPPEPPYAQREIPHFHSDIEAAKCLASHFGLEPKHRSTGWFVRPKAAYAKDPSLDSHSAEGHFNGATAICEAVITRLRTVAL